MTRWLRYVGLYWVSIIASAAVFSAWSHQAVKWRQIEGASIGCAILAGVPLAVWMAYHTRRSLKGAAE